MSQIYNGNTKKPKLKENKLGILGISSREFMYSGYISIFENTPKSCCISPLKVATTLPSGSGKGAVGA